MQFYRRSAFFSLVRLLASQIGSQVNFTVLANKLDVSLNTIKDWVSILQSSYITYSLEPFHVSVGYRAVKTPKIYFYDTGLASHILGIHTDGEFEKSEYNGHLFENFIIMELYKQASYHSPRTDFSYYRDASQNEIDLIIEQGTKVSCCKMKKSATLQPSPTEKLKRILNEIQKSSEFPEKITTIYTGDQKISSNINTHIPWNKMRLDDVF